MHKGANTGANLNGCTSETEEHAVGMTTRDGISAFILIPLVYGRLLELIL